ERWSRNMQIGEERHRFVHIPEMAYASLEELPAKNNADKKQERRLQSVNDLQKQSIKTFKSFHQLLAFAKPSQGRPIGKPPTHFFGYVSHSSMPPLYGGLNCCRKVLSLRKGAEQGKRLRLQLFEIDNQFLPMNCQINFLRPRQPQTLLPRVRLAFQHYIAGDV